MKKCRFCAEEIQDAALVCKHCGRDQSGKQQQPTIVVKPQADFVSKIAKGGVIAFILFVLYALVRTLTG